MPRGRREDEYIPIKIEGWNGKFVYDKTPDPMTIKTDRNFQHSDWRNFYAQNTEPTVLPPTWDGTFQTQGKGMPIQRDAAGQRNECDTQQYYVRITPETNYSDETNFFGYSDEPEILPPEWNGKFELSDEVRIRPERNFSDVRDYAEARRFRKQN